MPIRMVADALRCGGRRREVKVRHNYCVVRAMPNYPFIEEIGTKKMCMKFVKYAAKPFLRVCRMVPVVSWDAHGKKKEGYAK